MRFFLVAGTSNILHFISDGRDWGLTSKSSDHFVLFLFTFPFAYESSLSTLLEMQKASQMDWLFLVAGTRISSISFRMDVKRR
jgi:hypothetical protein